MATIKEYGLGIQTQEMAFKFGYFANGDRVYRINDVLHGRLGRVVAVPIDKVDSQSTEIFVPVCFPGTLNGQYEWIATSDLKRG
ncbi:MAG: hypothetical protein QG654_255 [Patescibacteria group bacterium]|nr:hypothetical protein [Patescibacteria group bacterium]